MEKATKKIPIKLEHPDVEMEGLDVEVKQKLVLEDQEMADTGVVIKNEINDDGKDMVKIKQDIEEWQSS